MSPSQPSVSTQRSVTTEPSNLGSPKQTEPVEANANSEISSGASNSLLPPAMVATEAVELEGVRARPSGSVAAAVADEQLQRWNIGGRSDPSHVSNRRDYHPGTRVRVDATPRFRTQFKRSKLGISLGKAILASLRNQGYWPFRICFETTARERTDHGGKSRLRMSFSGDGAVIAVHLVSTDLTHREIATCHASVAKKLRVAKLGLRRVDVDVLVSVWPGDAPLLPLPVSRSLPSQFDLEALTQKVKSLEPAVTRCMQLAQLVDPSLWGRLALSFEVDATKHPTAIQEYQSHFANEDATKCVVTLLENLELPLADATPVRLQASWRLHPSIPSSSTPTSDSAEPVSKESAEQP